MFHHELRQRSDFHNWFLQRDFGRVWQASAAAVADCGDEQAVQRACRRFEHAGWNVGDIQVTVDWDDKPIIAAAMTTPGAIALVTCQAARHLKRSGLPLPKDAEHVVIASAYYDLEPRPRRQWRHLTSQARASCQRAGVGTVLAVQGEGGRWPQGRWSRRGTDRRRATAALGLVIVVAIAVPVVGYANPWNLVVVNEVFDHGYVAALVVVVAAGLLFHLYVPGPLRRLLGWMGLAAIAGLWLLGGAALVFLRQMDPVLADERASNPRNDVEVVARHRGAHWNLWLHADRRLWSRENGLWSVGLGDSAPPPIELRFIDADELVVTSDGVAIYHVRFDPNDLDILSQECRTATTPRGWRTGCTGDA